jgi:cytochrome b
VVASVVSGKLGGNALDWHVWFGLAIFSLIIFRLVWGFVGGHHARFTSFVRGPKTVIAYVRGKYTSSLGHNPLGALSVLAILGTLFALAITGLFSNDDVLVEAPLYSLVSKDTSDWLTWLHTQSQYLIFLLVVLHIAAILYYRLWNKEDLVRPMITGSKTVAGDSKIPAPDKQVSVLLAAVIFAFNATLVFGVVTFIA